VSASWEQAFFLFNLFVEYACAFSGGILELLLSPRFGAGHPATPTIMDNSIDFPNLLRLCMAGSSHFPLSLLSAPIGVGHPECPVPEHRRTDPRRRKRDNPEGVTHGFQVRLYKVEPRVRSLTRNLFSKDD
jgi:hypothetical protein